MSPPACLVQVMVEVGPGRDEAVDVPVRDQVRDDHTEAAGAQGARRTQENDDLVCEHFLPDLMRGGQIPPLERDPFHAREDFPPPSGLAQAQTAPRARSGSATSWPCVLRRLNPESL